MNKVILSGRCVRDPELKFIAGSGMAVGDVTIAVDKGLSKDKKAEFEQKGKDTADFPRLKLWGKNAENLASLCRKGTMILVEGSYETGSYTKEDGTKVYTTEVNVQRWEKLSWDDEPRNQTADSGSSDNFNYGIDPSEFQAIENDDDVPF